MPMLPASAAPTTVGGKRCTIVGTSGNDVLSGGSKSDVICGLGGNDVIKGGGGNDIIDGGSGKDRLSGGTGNDIVVGGYGNDTLSGDGGGDRLLGGSGNDDLTGGAGSDIIDGGIGTDWCTLDSVDVLTRCVYDREAPVADNLRVGPATTVDVTLRSVEVSFTVDISDDTGVRQVQVMAQDSESGDALNLGLAGMISGDVRNGTWRITASVPRYAPPGKYTVEVSITDRVGRQGSATFTRALRVIDGNPDLERPDVVLLAPTPTTIVDVRDAMKTLVIRARITDALSGVADFPFFCAEFPMDDYYTHNGCVDANLVSGNSRDGVWEARVDIPARSIGGDWNISVWATDRARPADQAAVVGPDIFRAWTRDGAETTARLFPSGKGRFTVRGTSDSTAPVMVSVELTPDSVDTLERAADVTVRVRATDVEGVSSVGLWLHALSSETGSVSFLPVDLTLTEGTINDGWWTGTVTLPRGTPPGRYAVQAWVRDATHWRSYVSTSSPYAGTSGQATLTTTPDPGVSVIER
jgi:Ca2+-binding RTX toxin-like protein